MYNLGRYVYAYMRRRERIAGTSPSCPKGCGVARSRAERAPRSRVVGDGHIYQFFPKTGKWEHIDVRAVLDVVKEGKK